MYDSKHKDWSSLFGDVRSLLASHEDDANTISGDPWSLPVGRDTRRDSLLSALTSESRSSNADRHRAELVPYLDDYFQRHPRPVFDVYGSDDASGALATQSEHHPYALFSLRVEASWIDEVLSRADASKIHTLDMSPITGDGYAALDVLARHGHLDELRSITLPGVDFDRPLDALTRAKAFSHVTHLQVTTGTLRTASMASIVDAPGAASLVSLSCTRPILDDDGFAALFASEHLAALRVLSLRFADTRGSDAFDILARATGSTALLGLTHLDLQRTFFEKKAAALLASAPQLASLEHLNLDYNALSTKGAQSIARSGVLSNLEVLDVSSNGLGASGVQALADKKSALSALTHLNLFGNKPGMKGVVALASSPSLTNLRHLSLESCELDDGDVAAFADAMELPALERIELRGQQLGSNTELAMIKAGLSYDKATKVALRTP